MRISDWSSDVCSSDLANHHRNQQGQRRRQVEEGEHLLDVVRGRRAVSRTVVYRKGQKRQQRCKAHALGNTRKEKTSKDEPRPRAAGTIEDAKGPDQQPSLGSDRKSVGSGRVDQYA